MQEGIVHTLLAIIEDNLDIRTDPKIKDKITTGVVLESTVLL